MTRAQAQVRQTIKVMGVLRGKSTGGYRTMLNHRQHKLHMKTKTPADPNLPTCIIRNKPTASASARASKNKGGGYGKRTPQP